MPEDHELLRDYAKDRSENAFTELVRRRIDLVYSAAVRETRGDGALAQEITQEVFSELARKASKLCSHPALAGWLYTCVRLMSANARRSNDRRQRREQEAHTMNELLSADSTESSWRQVEPVLDDAMHELSETDRAAVVLRFFEDRSHKEVGLALGLSETAARKRVDRALGSLRALLAKRGVTVGASGLIVLISTNAVQAAPVGLAITISAAAVLTGTTIAATATATTIQAVAMTTLQKTIIGTTLAAAIGAGIYEARQASHLRDQVQSLKQQQAPLFEHLQQAQQQRDDATQRLTGIRNDNDRLNRNTLELVRLRAQVASYLARDRSPVADTPASTSQTLQWLPMDTNQFAPLSSDRTPEVLGYPQSLRDLAVANYTRVTNALANAKTAHDRYLALSEAAKLAFAFGDTERKYGNEVLALDKSFRTPLGGDATFSGNLVLGRIALREGQMEDAKRYLLEAGQTPGSPSLNSFGPNMTLARDLLRAGEQDTVLQYFELCRKFWGSAGEDNLARWTRDVRAGNMPDFGGNIYY